MSGLLSFVVSLGFSRAIPDQVEVRFGLPACAAKVQEPAQALCYDDEHTSNNRELGLGSHWAA
jgi:hypothetical protein